MINKTYQQVKGIQFFFSYDGEYIREVSLEVLVYLGKCLCWPGNKGAFVITCYKVFLYDALGELAGARCDPTGFNVGKFSSLGCVHFLLIEIGNGCFF